MNLNIKKSARYQLTDARKMLLIYYLVIVLVQAANVIVAYVVKSNTPYFIVVGSSSTVDSITAVFLFVVGLCSFKENFGMLVQNGFSRKALFAGRMAAFGMLALVTSVADLLLTLLLNLLTGQLGLYAYITTFQGLYSLGGTPPSGVLGFILGLVFTLLMYFTILIAGYFLTILFYRLNTLGKVLVGAGVPILLTMVLPALDYFTTGGRVFGALWWFVRQAFGLPQGMPLLGILSLAATGAAGGLFCWLLLRRATVRR